MSEESKIIDKLHARQAELDMKKVPWKAHAVVSIGILIIAYLGINAMFATQPEAKRFKGRPSPAVTVETTKLMPSDYQVWIDSYGSATPLTLTKLVSDVNGRVIEVSNQIRAGSKFAKGDVLLRIDPRDYKISVDVAEAAVADAEVKYQQEIAEAQIRKQEWNIKPKDAKGKSLALREPQVKAALASLQSAKARLSKAELDLERTEVKAPFNGKILKQHVDIGQVVSPSQAIAEIYATEQLEIRLPIKTQDLHQIDLLTLGINEQAPRVILESRIGDKTYQWFGQLVRSEGAYDTKNRMLYVVARVNNPFEATGSTPAMRVGQFFEAKIQGRTLPNIFALPRRAVTQDNTISIAHEGQLQKLNIAPIWTDREAVVIAATDLINPGSAMQRQFNQNDLLILTPTANLINGTRVKLIQPEGQSSKGSGKKSRRAQKADKVTDKTMAQ